MKFVEDTFVFKTSMRDYSIDLEFTCDLYLFLNTSENYLTNVSRQANGSKCLSEGF